MPETGAVSLGGESLERKRAKALGCKQGSKHWMRSAKQLLKSGTFKIVSQLEDHSDEECSEGEVLHPTVA